MSFDSTKKNWEGLAKKDPMWAILTNDNHKNGGWNRDQFFATGTREIDIIFDYLKSKNFIPTDNESALDFGCGIGRLMRALYPKFNHITGVDVSETMIRNGIELNKKFSDKLIFLVNKENNLNCFHSNEFSFIYSPIVLQHIPYPQSINYIKEFLRVLKPGGILLFQVPTKDIRNLSIIQKLKSYLKLRERLALLGIGNNFSMEMNILNENEINDNIQQNKATLLNILITNHTDPEYDGIIRFINEKESKYFISKMFIIRKN